jgi:hypothetical protein
MLACLTMVVSSTQAERGWVSRKPSLTHSGPCTTAATSASISPAVRAGKFIAVTVRKSCVSASAWLSSTLRPGTPISLMAMPRMSPLMSGSVALAEFE